MRKITERDSIEIYNQIGIMPWRSNPKYSKSKTRHQIDRYWLDHTFTPAQQNILIKLNYTARPHPKHNPTVEIFIDEQLCTPQDWTLIYLMFNSPK